jgi:peptidase MA superfamily protein
MPRVLLTLLLPFVVALSFSPALGPSEPGFVDPAMSYAFGESIRFSARVIILEGDDPAQPAEDPLIFLSVAGRTDTFTAEADYDPATGEVSYVYTVQPGALTPFAELAYQFQVTLADGSPLLSPPYSGTYADTRFDWHRREDAPVTIHWFEGGADFAQQAADTARAGLERIHELLPSAKLNPIDIYIYASPTDLQTALGHSEAGWIAGEAVPEQDAAFVSITPGPEQRAEMERQIPHELAHLAHYQLAEPGWKNQPAWLREGIASQAELTPNPDYDGALNGEPLLMLADLCGGFPADSRAAFLAYAESDSFVGYLRAKYGASGLQTLTDAYSDGLDCEQGPARAFGAPLGTLEKAWLAGLTATPAARPTEAVGSAGNFVSVLVLLGVILIVPLALAFSGRRRHE